MRLDLLEEVHATADVWVQELSDLRPDQRRYGAPRILTQLSAALANEAQLLLMADHTPDALIQLHQRNVGMLIGDVLAASRAGDWCASVRELRDGLEALFLVTEDSLSGDSSSAPRL